MSAPLSQSATTPAAIDPPDTLSGDALQKFRTLVAQLHARGVRLVPEDADRLGEYCDAWAIRRRAVEELKDEPLTLSGPNGARYTNPLNKVIAQCEKCMQAVSKQYGLDLKSRIGSAARDGLGKSGTVSKLQQFIDAGRRLPVPSAPGDPLRA